MIPKRVILLVAAFLYTATFSHSFAKEDCPRKYPNDAGAQCVCECSNTFEDKVKACPSEVCIGAAAEARKICILKCFEKYDNNGYGDGVPMYDGYPLDYGRHEY